MSKITFNHVTIENFGPFKSKQQVSLDVMAERPVILIKALNGSGKTTLLTALQISLYGRKTFYAAKSNEYEIVVSDSLRKDVTTPASIQLELTLEQGDVQQQITLMRIWAPGPKFKEDFKVLVNGQFDSEWTQRWDEFINGVLPVELVQLFLFDGEKIEALANPERLPELLKHASEVFLGLGGIDALNNDLKALERRSYLAKKNESAHEPDQYREQLETLVKALEEQNAKVTLLLQIKADSRNALDAAEKALNKYAIAANRSGADSFKKAAGLRSDLQVASQQHTAAVNALIELMEHPLVPLIWLDTAWSSFKVLWESNRQGRHSMLLSSEFARRDAKLLAELKDRSPTAHDAVASLMKSDLEAFNTTFIEVPVLTPDTDPTDIEVQLKRLVKDIQRQSALLLRSQSAMEKAERAISHIPDEEQLTEILLTLQEKTTAVAVCKSQLQETQSRLEEAQGSYFLTEAKIETVKQKMGTAFANMTLEHKSIQASTRAREVLRIFKERLLYSKATWLSSSISVEFKKLLRKQNLITEVLVDPMTYRVSIRDIQGNMLPMERLSAGERQLLAIAVLSALISEHKGRFPVVVDTPLARLDRGHRSLLIENFFTKVSHQVVVLSTDEEVDGQSYSSIEPYLSRETSLRYDDQSAQSIVEEHSFIHPEEATA